MADYNAWAGPYGLHLPPRADVLALSRTDERIWSTVLEDDDTLYVQFNRFELPPLDALQAITDGIARPDVQRVVVDVRHNFGGQVGSDQPLRDILIPYGAANPGPSVLLTGRNTFSAGFALRDRPRRRGRSADRGRADGRGAGLLGR